MSHTRVLLADDHRLILDALRALLEPTCEVVGAVKDGRALLDAASALKPDVMVIDIAMPLLNGLEAGRRLKDIMPLAKLIYLTMNEDADLALRAIRGGASAYLLKTSAASELLHAIHVTLKGGRYVTPTIASALMDAFIRNPEGAAAEKQLTARQREVLQVLAEGKSMKEASDILQVTPRTVAFHKYRMMRELGIKTSAELIRIAIKKHVLVT